MVNALRAHEGKKKADQEADSEVPKDVTTNTKTSSPKAEVCTTDCD